MKYTVYFELYGKKMKTIVNAKSEHEAKELVKSKIIFHRIESRIDDDEMLDHFASIFGFKP
jgi:hypothetical protein